MKKYLFILLVLNFCFASNAEIWNNKLLFCLDKNIDPLTIINKKENISTNIEKLNILLSNIQAISLEPWLPGATQDDFTEEIYLNRIYRLTFNSKNKNEIATLIDQLSGFDFIHSAEFEFKRKPLYTPNDQYYNNQWFLPAINANEAWDLWNINGGELPGNKNIILASVDLGVVILLFGRRAGVDIVSI